MGSDNHSYSTTIISGNTSTITGSPINIACNDVSGYAVYAIGFSNDSYTDTTHTDMISSLGSSYNIKTNGTDGASNWKMKLDNTASVNATIDNSFDTFQDIPSSFTKVAYHTSSTDTASITPVYQIYIGTTQAAGSYTGKVKYTLVHPNAAIPQEKYYMQDFTIGMCEVLANNGPITVYDKRDEQAYTVALLKDGKCWMTTNLNLAGGTALSADDTDITSTYIDNFTGSADMDTSPRLVKSDNSIMLPGSDAAGFNNNSNAYVYNSGTTTNCGASGQNTPCYSYYSWIAATLGGMQSDGSTAQTTDGYNAAASICPKGWRLPTSTTSNAPAITGPNWKTGDWYALASAYEANLENDYYESVATFYNNAGPGTTPNFLLAGYYHNGSFSYGGSRGYYWSATSYSDTSDARNLDFDSSNVNSAGLNARNYGFSVRCLFVGQ